METLETRVLLAADIQVDASLEMAHGAGCACAACGCVSDEFAGTHTAGELLGDHHELSDLRFSPDGKAFYFDPAPEAGDPADGGDTDGEPDTDPREGLIVPIFHSNPSASKKIFLDFDGHVVTGTSWNQFNNGNPIYAPAFSSDGNIFDFSSSELSRIEQTWQRIAEDYAPFDVDVTTEEPPASLFTDGNQAIRVLFSTDRDEPALGGTGNYWYSGAGGVAFLNSWSYRTDTPVWVFENNLGASAKNMAEAGSHEVGHALNLSHDGTGSASYYSGHGGSGVTSWAPIMGVGYNRNVTQWSRGEYNGANNTQNDLAIINNRLSYRTDDHSSLVADAAAASPLVSVGDIAVNVAGIIERSSDVDVFRIDAFGTTSVNLQIDPFEIGPNLDIEATIYDSFGAFVASSNPTNQLGASFDLNLPAGTYTLVIDGVGYATPANGFSDYASIGQYNITGTIEFADPVPGGPQVTATPVPNSRVNPTSVVVTFDQPIDQASVSTSDIVSFLDPNGQDASGQITSVTFPAVDQLQINFTPLTVDGFYQVTIGPQILDFEGLAMDQNQNGTAGEADDAYSFMIDVDGDTAPGFGPRIAGQPVVDNPTAASSLTVTFDQSMDTSSFDITEDILFFEGPSVGALLDLTGFTWLSMTTLRIEFLTQLDVGDYIMAIGPDIRDLEGLPMDQDGNGTSGQPSDLYVAEFQVIPDTTPGDFNNDGVVDATDIDLLCGAVNAGTNDAAFDLTSDGAVTMADMDELILNTIGTLYGDANLDFVVDASDFNAWNENKFTSGSGWAGGDFNCDGTSDTSDFNIWNTNKFQSAAAPVPTTGNQPVADFETRAKVDVGIGTAGPAESRPEQERMNPANAATRDGRLAARRTIRWGESQKENAAQTDAFWASFA